MLNDYEQLSQNSKVISWNDSKIEVRILDDFERNTGVKQAFSENINRFSVYVIINLNPPYTSHYIDGLVTEIRGILENGPNSTFTYQPSCTSDTWTCGNWNTCQWWDSVQTRTCSLTFDCPLFSTSSPITTQSCVPSCVSESWTCGEWSVCSAEGTQTRSCNKSYNCEGGISIPATTQSCTYVPPCTSSDWSCTNWSACSQNNSQTRTCTKTSNCHGGASSPATTQSCTYIPPCISFLYSSWSECTPDGQQTRVILSKYPSNCEGGESPKTTQSCTYIPPCNVDTWTCGSWGLCSPSGIQSRSCAKTFDCPNIQTASPITDQYCEPPNRPTQQTPPSGTDEISNQDLIIKSTVKLLCPVDAYRASQGSGTVIDPSGTILTNKHVIAGTLGCLVGFIDNFDDEPYFGERQIADIFKTSPTSDIAILKIRNPQNKILSSINIMKGSINFSLGTKITTYGYPAAFGKKITYTSGDFSGTDGNYLKTTAILEYGNSGGGAYLKDGTFVGIPSAVVRGELNSLGYVLSINIIKAWLTNSSIVLDSRNNEYSRVSVLEDMDLNKLGSLKLFIPKTDTKGDPVTSATNQNSQNTKEQPQLDQTQKESIVSGPTSQPEEERIEEPKEELTKPLTPEDKPKKSRSFVANIFEIISGFLSKIFKKLF